MANKNNHYEYYFNRGFRDFVAKICKFCKKEFKIPKCLIHSYTYCCKDCKRKDRVGKPYVRNVNRRYDRCIDESGNHVAYHIYIMEKHIGRKLTENEIVHHIDKDTHNNNLENLVILSDAEHRKIHEKWPIKEFKCKNCDKSIYRRESQPHTFCSINCFNEHRSKDKIYTCSWCGISFTKHGQGNRIYKCCSRSCSNRLRYNKLSVAD